MADHLGRAENPGTSQGGALDKAPLHRGDVVVDSRREPMRSAFSGPACKRKWEPRWSWGIRPVRWNALPVRLSFRDVPGAGSRRARHVLLSVGVEPSAAIPEWDGGFTMLWIPPARSSTWTSRAPERKPVVAMPPLT